ncbi:hypothetical protein ACHAPI_012300 [Fusarium lateritium]
MDAKAAARLPIKRFSSGATNSLAGATYLSGIYGRNALVNPKTSQVIMVDIGGTTSNFAALAPSGFPRQSPATIEVGGVQTAFRLPELVSIGLGGGSHVVSHEDGSVTVGPISVGYQLPKLSKCFGADILTATEIVVAAGAPNDLATTVNVEVSNDVLLKAQQEIRRKLERSIDDMKVSDQDVVLLLVGGGSIILIDEFRNVKACIRFPFFNVANAVGAAIAKVSGEVDQVETAGSRSKEEIIEEIKTKAIEAACLHGATRDTVKVAEVDCVPIQYTTQAAYRVIVRACGELDWKQVDLRAVDEDGCEMETHLSIETEASPEEPGGTSATVDGDRDLNRYKPEVSKATGEWFIPETDLAFIAEGCGVLGTSGGGITYATYLHSIETLRNLPKGSMRIINPRSLDDKSRVGIVGRVGAPTTSDERLGGEHEFQYTCEKLLTYLQLTSFAGLASGEVGGGNGLCPLPVAAAMGIPVLDGGLIGRAFPKLDMCLPYVYGVEQPYPAVLADPRGNSQVIAEVDSPARLERIIRAGCIELGLSCAFAASVSSHNFKLYSCHQTLSQSWYIGRAILTARQQKRHIVKSLNEFLYAGIKQSGGPLSTMCTTPNLIAVLDNAGTSIGTHELRYGQMVTVIAMPAHPLWTAAPGMKASDPASFGLKTEYMAFESKWQQPTSVFEEFAK